MRTDNLQFGFMARKGMAGAIFNSSSAAGEKPSKEQSSVKSF